MKGLKLFQGDEHNPFKWSGGQPAALLVHGFPGTPAEMRALGESLNRAGWTVHGPLLPGFGADIDTLFQRQTSEWLGAVEATLRDLQREHHPVLLIGYSMGAALALNVAAACPPNGLILLAPFWQMGNTWQKWLGFFLKPFLRKVRPFQKADFSDPQVRRGVSNLLSEIDLDDPDVQQTLRELAIPLDVFERLHRLGQAAYRVAGESWLPTLAIQGTLDEVVRLDQTHRLLQRLRGPLQYVQVEAGHDLTRSDQPAWPTIEQAVLTFAQSLLDQETKDRALIR